MKENDKLIRVYSGTESLVGILKDKLEQNGIPANIKNDSGDSFLSGTPIALDLFIRQPDIKKAEPIIKEFVKQNQFIYKQTDDMNGSVIIRPIAISEIGFLDKMLYNAIFVPPGNERLPDNIIEHPEISKYVKDFGREGDLCLVAQINGELVGAIWTRHFNETNKAFGFVDSDTPEIAMAVYEQFRKKGIGATLLNAMIKTLTDKGYKQISLSVDIINYAYDLYKKCGFTDYKLVGESMTMIKKLI